MNNEERIKALQESIDRLSMDLRSANWKLGELQRELEQLQQQDTSTHRAPSVTGRPRSGPRFTVKPVPQSSPGLESFIGLRLIHLVGIVVLVIGISIGVKYAIDKALISEWLRIMLAYGAGLILFLISLRLRKKYHLFSAILFSGSMASIYFTTYAAFVYYQMMPGIVAFVLMILLTVYTVFTALGYDRMEIAIIGMTGAYGIPFLISTNTERIDLFFTYILLINTGVVFISFRKQWRLLGFLSMLITWVLVIGWAWLQYSRDYVEVVMVFVLLFYFLFSANALAFLLRRGLALSVSSIQQVAVNNTLFYLTAMAVFNDDPFSLATAGTVTGVVFILVTALGVAVRFFFPAEIELQRLLAVQSITLAMLFIAIQWDGLVVTLSWMGIAVVLFVVGINRHHSWLRLTSVLLIGFTLAKLLFFDSAHFSTVQKIICYILMGVLLLLFSFYYQRLGLSQKKEAEPGN